MLTVNLFYLNAFLNPICGSADYDVYGGAGVRDGENYERRVRAVIRDELLPYYEGWAEVHKEKAKECLRYILSRRETHDLKLGSEVERQFDGALTNIEVLSPEMAYRFYEMLWQEFFADEPVRASSIEEARFVVESIVGSSLFG